VLNFVLVLHTYNFYLIAPLGLITGIWGLILYFTRKDLSVIPQPWRILLWVTGGVGALQGLLGLIMLLLGSPLPGGGKDLYYLHYVYGGIVALILPLAYVTYVTGGKNVRRDILIYSIAAIILAAAGVRAWMTGPA
jgi:hypothetical protein